VSDAAAPKGNGIGRASAFLASGTIVSRILGFVSVVFLTQTLSQGSIGANMFALANQLPSNIYAIIAGGLLSSVFVPAIVRAGLHADGGQGFINRLVTLGFIVFFAAGLIATVLAPALVRLYADFGPAELNEVDLGLATAFAYWCLPQVFFYALYSLLGEVLNARGIFGPFTWAPVINNIVVIGGLILFASLFGSDGENFRSGQWTPGMIALVAGAATLGVAGQAFVLTLFWRRAGLTYRPNFRFRGVGLGATGKAAAWTFGMILVTQLAGIVQTNVASIAAASDDSDASLVVLRNTWLIFMLPHSIAVVSIATAYFTRMSTHVRDGKIGLLRDDFAASMRSSGMIIVFAAVGLIVLAYPFSAVFAKNGFADVADMAPVLIAFLLGLVPFSVLYLLRRTFYALGDTRTPFFITVFQAVLFVIGALIVSALPPHLIAVGIAVVTTIAGTAQTVLAAILLRRKLDTLHGREVLRRYVQFIVASIPAAVVGVLIVWLLGAFTAGFGSATPFGGIVTLAVAGGAMAVVYAVALKLMHNPELEAFAGPIMRRLGRSR